MTREELLQRKAALERRAELLAKQGTSENTSVRDSIANNPIIAALVGAGRSVPGSDLATAAVGQMIDYAEAPFTGEPVNPIESFKRNYSQAKKIGEEVESNSPIASGAGRVVGNIAQYGTGMNALKAGGPAKGFVGNLIKALKGAVVNAAVGQGGRGFEVDPKATVIDAALGGGGELLSSGINAVGKGLSEVPSKLMNRAVGTKPKQILKGKDIGQELVDRGVVGTKGQLMKKAEKAIAENEAALQELLSKSGTVDKNIILKELQALRSEYAKPGQQSFLSQVDNLIDEISKDPKFDSLAAKEANQLKRFIYDKVLGDNAYMADKLPGFKESQKALARGYKRAIEAVAPEAQALNKELSVYGGLKRGLSELAAKGEAATNPLDVIKRVAQLTGGSGLGFAAGGYGGAAAGAIGSQLATSTLGRTGSAQAISFLSKLLQKSNAGRYLGPAVSATGNQ